MQDNGPPPYLALHLEEFRRHLDLRGLSVLEIGGCLPRRMALETTGARQWIGVDLPEYWTESGDGNPSQHYDVPTFPIDQASRALACDHALLLGDAIGLPTDIEPFDAVFSSCAFEHIQGLEERIRHLRKVMRKGALLFAIAMPIWSSPHGSHMLPLRDNAGNLWLPEAIDLPPWHQLLWTPEEMTAHLTALKLPPEIVGQAVHWVHQSKHLNRLFAGDYARLALDVDFAEHRVFYANPVEWADRETMKVLEMLYPGKGPFDRAGVLLLLRA